MKYEISSSHVMYDENTPLTLKTNQLEEFMLYVWKRFHSHFNEIFEKSKRLIIDHTKLPYVHVIDYQLIKFLSNCAHAPMTY